MDNLLTVLHKIVEETLKFLFVYEGHYVSNQNAP